MGHRHFPGSSQYFDDEHDQGRNHIHPEHPYMGLGNIVLYFYGSLMIFRLIEINLSTSFTI